MLTKLNSGGTFLRMYLLCCCRYFLTITCINLSYLHLRFSNILSTFTNIFFF